MIEQWQPADEVLSNEFFKGLNSKKLSPSALAPESSYRARLVLNRSAVQFRAAEYAVKLLDMQPFRDRRLRLPAPRRKLQLVTFAPVCPDTARVLPEQDTLAITEEGEISRYIGFRFLPLGVLEPTQGYFVADYHDPGGFPGFMPKAPDTLEPDQSLAVLSTSI